MVEVVRATACLVTGAMLLPPLPLLAAPALLWLERVDARTCSDDGTIDLWVREVTVRGEWVDVDPQQYRLVRDGVLDAAAPISGLPFAESDDALAVGLVVQTNLSFAGDMESVRAGLLALTQNLPERTRGFLVVYHREVRVPFAYGRLAGLREEVAQLAAVNAGEGRLLEALSTALDVFGKLPPSRRVLVIVSDGIEEQMDPESGFRALGDRAYREGVTLFPIAFSPLDERVPFLNLGEIAKRTRGTFRWAKTAGDLAAEATNLADELSSTRILHFPTEARACAARSLAVARESFTSNTRIDRAGLDEDGAALPELGALSEWRTNSRWIYVAAMVLVGAAGVAAAFWMVRRRRTMGK